MPNPKKINIRDAITQCDYSPAIKQDFVKFLESNFGSQKHKLYLFARNDNAPKLFLLQLQIPAKFNGNSYDISLLVYFPLSFPEIEPEIFFQKIGKVKINPNCAFYVDEETLKVNYSLFYSWEKSFESFKGLINELYNQFNIAFPIFNLPNENNDDVNNEGDCVFKKNLSKEIELLAPTNRINNDINIAMNQLSNIIINDGNDNFNKEESLQNPYYRANNVNTNVNSQMSNVIRNSNPVYNNNDMKNMGGQIPINKNALFFDEQKAKAALINLLQRNLGPKIKYAIQPIQNSYLKLEKIRNDLIGKLKDLSIIETKCGAISQTINSVRKELDSYTMIQPQGLENIDLSNLDSLLIITNKDYYLRLAKEKAIEEYILIAKKAYEKQNIDFGSVLNLIRTNTRDIFFLKYKNQHPNSY